MVFRRRPRPQWFVYLPTRTGWVQRSTGTSDKATAQAIERMLLALGPRGKRAWDLLDDVAAGQLSLGTLYDAWRLDDLEGLRARRADVDLCEHLSGWQAWLRDRTKTDTAAHYLTHLRTMMPEGRPFWRSQLTAPAVARWLATRTALVQKRRPKVATPQPTRAVSAGTKRKYLAAVQSFARYLVGLGILPSNPVRDVSPPRPRNPAAVSSSCPKCCGWSKVLPCPIAPSSRWLTALGSR